MKEQPRDRETQIEPKHQEECYCGTIHYTELSSFHPDNPLYREGEFYRREVGRLLAEGREGQFVLIKGEEIIGLFDTLDEAMNTGNLRYPKQPFLVRQVLTRELRLRVGWMWRPHAASYVPNNRRGDGCTGRRGHEG